MSTPGKVELWTVGVGMPGLAERTAARAEAAGWDGMLVVDSQNLAGDPYVGLTLAASATRAPEARHGRHQPGDPPSGRHRGGRGEPAGRVAAGGCSSASAAATRRSPHLGLGAGAGGAARALRPRRPRRSSATRRSRSPTWREYMPAGVRPVDVLGLADTPSTSRLKWLPRDLAPVPVEVAATGPRVLRLAALHADRVMLAVGADPARVALGGRRTCAGSRDESGLDPDGVAIGSYVNVVCDPDLDAARSMIAGGLATFARFSVMDGEVRTPVDAGQQKVLVDLHGAYDMQHHTEVGSPQTGADAGRVRRPLRHRRLGRPLRRPASASWPRSASTGSSSAARRWAPTATAPAPPSPASPRRSSGLRADDRSALLGADRPGSGTIVPRTVGRSRPEPLRWRRRVDRSEPSEGGTMAQFDLVIRNGLVLDGSGARASRLVAVRDGVVAEVGDVDGTATRDDRRRRRARHARLRRHPHPLRRPGDVGRAPRAVGVARRHDGRDGQLRRRVRAGAPRATATA